MLLAYYVYYVSRREHVQRKIDVPLRHYMTERYFKNNLQDIELPVLQVCGKPFKVRALHPCQIPQPVLESTEQMS